jgi:hypothetical protein
LAFLVDLVLLVNAVYADWKVLLVFQEKQGEKALLV